MCGIFGITVNKQTNISNDLLISIINDLFLLSESRGKEAAGIAITSGSKINVYKKSIPASVMIRSKGFKHFLNDSVNSNIRNSNGLISSPIAIIGHSRLVTNGSMEIHDNNQPVITDRIVGVHNGIIVNDKELWEKNKEINRKYEVDTEVILSLIEDFYSKNPSLINSINQAYQKIIGATTIATLFEENDALVIATNNGSLYVCEDRSKGLLIFTSERYILYSLLKKNYFNFLSETDINWVKPNSGFIIDIYNSNFHKFVINGKENKNIISKRDIHKYQIHDQSFEKKYNLGIRDSTSDVNNRININFNNNFEQTILNNFPHELNFKRCSQCILPETFPFIEFDDKGVCNYCNNHKKIKRCGKEKLNEYLSGYRSGNGEADCLISVSGGRDSCYGLYYLKDKMKMNPIAYTYDWGMVTDLARRNISRMCDKLGIEHIIISADIRQKRINIRKNINAWLKKPDLGMVPLFMAGDKQFYYFANKLSKQTDIDLMIFCAGNHYEKTDFKTGFCGIKEGSTEGQLKLSIWNKLKLFNYYGKQFLFNSMYINSSLTDTFRAFLSSYYIPHNYIFLFNYIDWDEDNIMTILRNDFEWELADDTTSTWRIGDGTSAFYNYIYYLVAGFTENDTFRSNQIREGALSRKKALSIVKEENKPRINGLKWYFDVLGLDGIEILKRVNQIPRLY